MRQTRNQQQRCSCLTATRTASADASLAALTTDVDGAVIPDTVTAPVPDNAHAVSDPWLTVVSPESIKLGCNTNAAQARIPIDMPS